MTFEEFKHQINSDEEIPDEAKIKCNRGMLCFEWEDYSEREVILKHKYITLPQFYST